MDVFEDIVLIKRQNFLVPDRLVIGKLGDKGAEASIEWNEISVPAVIPEFDGLTHHYMELTAPDAGEEISIFYQIVLLQFDTKVCYRIFQYNLRRARRW